MREVVEQRRHSELQLCTLWRYVWENEVDGPRVFKENSPLPILQKVFGFSLSLALEGADSLQMSFGGPVSTG